MKQSLTEFCKNYAMEYLLSEWDQKENGSLTPDIVSYGSHRSIWWKCPEGHRWQATPGHRTISNTGCPYCSGRIVSDESNLFSTNPDLVVEWNYDRNLLLTPDMFTAGSHRSVWWKCRTGHEWKATIKSRTDGCGCPYCSNRKILKGFNDLESVYPGIAAQWHPERNGTLTPDVVFPGSEKRVWWKCSQGHEWRSSVYARVRGNDCPVCANRKVKAGENDFASVAPLLAFEWCYEKNNPLRPEDVTACSSRRVWWKCSLGHEWRTTVAARVTASSGCPYCAGKKVLTGFNDLQTVLPDIAAQWHPDLNGGLTPDKVTRGSTKKVWWQCSDGHVWQALVSARTGQGTGCPECAGKMKIADRNRLALAKLKAKNEKDSDHTEDIGQNPQEYNDT